MSAGDGNRVRDSLVRAAQEMLSEGEMNPAIPVIVERAGVGVGSFYRYFAGKDDLVAAAVRRTTEDHVEWLAGQTGGISDPLERAAALFWSVCSIPEARPMVARMYANPTTSRLMMSARAEEAQIPVIAAALAACGQDPADATAALTVASTTLVHLMTSAVEQGAMPYDEAERMLVVCLRGLGVDGERARALAAESRPAATRQA